MFSLVEALQFAEKKMPKPEWNMLESKLCILDDVFIKIFKRCCNKNLNSEHITFLLLERTGLFIYLFIYSFLLLIAMLLICTNSNAKCRISKQVDGRCQTDVTTTTKVRLLGYNDRLE